MMRGGDKQRSFRILARALERLGSHDWRLLVVGDGPRRIASRKASAPFRPSRIRFLGALPPTARRVLRRRRPDGLACHQRSLRHGPAGSPGRRPARRRRPTGGVPEIVRDGVTGLLTPIGDETAFAEAVASLLTDGARRAAMGAAAARIAATEHSFAGASRTLDALLKQIAGSR